MVAQVVHPLVHNQALDRSYLQAAILKEIPSSAEVRMGDGVGQSLVAERK